MFDEFDVELFNERQADVVIRGGRLIPWFVGEILLQILRLETAAVTGKDSITHDSAHGIVEKAELMVVEQRRAGKEEAPASESLDRLKNVGTKIGKIRKL